MLASLMLVAVASAEPPPAAEDGIRYHPEPVWVQVPHPSAGLAHELLLPLRVDFFTDCTGEDDPSSCGPPPARWVGDNNPIEVCTTHQGRPPFVPAEQFRAMVARAADVWNQAGAAVGVRYTGDCPGGARWGFNNERNEIGWDEGGRLVRGAEAGLTRGSWAVRANGDKEFVEADVVIGSRDIAGVPDICLESIVIHEIGHAIGFGHSDTRGDMMYPSFDPGDVSTCPVQPSARERVRLQELYGANQPPAVDPLEDRVVGPGSRVNIDAGGSDPEGDSLTWQWQQLSGPPVVLGASGAAAHFTAPTSATEPIVLEATAYDRYLANTSVTIEIAVDLNAAAPTVAPSLTSFLGGDGVRHALLTWSDVESTASYRLCSRPAGGGRSDCSSLAQPVVAVDWDAVVTAAGPADATRVFTEGAREVTLAACGSRGCSPPGEGGLVGGLRWTPWRIDFDYFALAYDVADLRFTIVGVVNNSNESRRFELRTGPLDDPNSELIHDCGTVRPGGTCINFLGVGDDHYEAVSIVSRGAGSPRTEHHLVVR